MTLHSEAFEQWLKNNKNFMGPLGDLNKTIIDVSTRLAKQHLRIVSDNLALWSDQVQRLVELKRPEDFFKLQRDCINENITASMEGVQKLMDSYLKNFETVNTTFSATRDATLKTADKANRDTMRNAEKVMKDRQQEDR